MRVDPCPPGSALFFFGGGLRHEFLWVVPGDRLAFGSTATATGRMNLNLVTTFARFEREQTAERIRDKIAAAKAKGNYCGGERCRDMS